MREAGSGHRPCRVLQVGFGCSQPSFLYSAPYIFLLLFFTGDADVGAALWLILWCWVPLFCRLWGQRSFVFLIHGNDQWVMHIGERKGFPSNEKKNKNKNCMSCGGCNPGHFLSCSFSCFSCLDFFFHCRKWRVLIDIARTPLQIRDF